MVELIRTNNPVLLSWLTAALRDDGIEMQVLDRFTSVAEGSISAIQARIMVAEADFPAARRRVKEAEVLARAKSGEPDHG